MSSTLLSSPSVVTGDSKWLTVATRVVDCYYNVTNLPPGGVFRFRVSCVNKAGQGPHSNPSAPVRLDSSAGISYTVKLPNMRVAEGHFNIKENLKPLTMSTCF